MAPSVEDSDSSDESWQSAPDGEDVQASPPPNAPPEDPNATTSASQQNAASFSGHGNRGWQVGQNQGGNVAKTINIYNNGERPSNFAHAAEYMQSLSSPYRQQKNANPARTPRTCEWFLQDERFQQWRDTDDAHLLHVFAAPGCGKSVLARALVDEGLLANPRTSAVVYYFFKSGQGEQDRAFRAVASLLHQIYVKVSDPSLKNFAKSRYEAHGIKLCQMFDELWDILVETTAHVDGNVVCVVDALDECVEHDRISIITEIATFYARAGPLPNLKLLVLSRPYRDVDFYPGISRKRSNFIRFDGDDKSEIIAQEINMVIEDRIPVIMADLDEVDQEEITEYLRGMENRTYLWLYLILEYVQKNIAFHGTEGDIKKLLNEVPPEVDEAYERMLKRSPYPKLTQCLLSIVLAAKRPLTTNECKLALKIAQKLPIEIQPKTSELKMETDAQFERSLKDLCGLLLSVRNSQIYFIHETAREFLLGREKHSTTSPWKHTFDLCEAHGLLAETCLAYLSFSNYHIENVDPSMPFAGYARHYWISHYERGPQHLCKKLESSMSRILSTGSGCYTIWAQKGTAPLLHHLCEAGLRDLVTTAVQLGAKVNDRNARRDTALHTALIWRNPNVLSPLLESDADLSLRNGRRHTVFTDDIGFSPLERVCLLVPLWRSAKPGQPLDTEFFRGAVLATIISKDPALLKMVLDFPCGFKASEKDIYSAVHSFSATGYLESIQDLRDNQQIIRTIGGVTNFDSILATKASLDEDIIAHLRLNSEIQSNVETFLTLNTSQD